MISYGASSYELNDKTQYPYFSRTIPSDLSQCEAMAELLRYLNWTYVYAVHTDDSYGIHGIKLLRSEAKKRGEFKTKFFCMLPNVHLKLRPVLYVDFPSRRIQFK